MMEVEEKKRERKWRRGMGEHLTATKKESPTREADNIAFMNVVLVSFSNGCFSAFLDDFMENNLVFVLC